MNRVLYSLDEVAQRITTGARLVLAGDEAVLSKLPKGRWIGGTIPYFMGADGGVMSKDLIHVTELPASVETASCTTYRADTIARVYADAPANGFSIIIIPAASPTHLSFAVNAPTYEGFATSPLIGWISGVHVDEIGKRRAKVFFGETGEALEDGAVVMQATLPAGTYADLNIINIFSQGDGDTITFPEDGFIVGDAFINGENTNFADYIAARKLDTRLPLVANYCGAMINISIQRIDTASRRVHLYAPVFRDVQYRHAAPVGDYVREFTGHLPHDGIDSIFFSCNCILNYLYSELEGRKTGGITGPITFGEIAYQLLNQTMAYLTIRSL